VSSPRSRLGTDGRQGAVGRGTDALGGLLELHVRRPASPPSASPDGPGVESWEDREGRLAGYGHAEAGWLHLPRVGTFAFSPRGIELDAVPDATAESIHNAHRRLALPLVLAALGHQVLHASAVLTGAGALVLCARSGTGKSTLAHALSRRGLSACADDAVALDLSGGAPLMISLPFRLRLLSESRAHFSLDGQQVEGSDDAGRTAPVAALCVLERAGVAAPVIERLSPADAFPALLAHAYGFGLADAARKRLMVQRYLALASKAPVLRVTVPDGLERVDGTAEAIERAVAEVAG
jgi:hypothetical protein